MIIEIESKHDVFDYNIGSAKYEGLGETFFQRLACEWLCFIHATIVTREIQDVAKNCIDRDEIKLYRQVWLARDAAICFE